MGIMKVLGVQNVEDVVDCAFHGQDMVDHVTKAIDDHDSTRYSLILTDCSMPIMDGYEAVRQIRYLLREQDERIKIVAVTGHVEAEYLKKAEDCGMDMVIPKPFPIGLLGQILKEFGFIAELPSHLVDDCQEL